VREEAMARGSGVDWFSAEVEECVVLCSVPPARELSLEVKPRRW